MSGIEGDDSDDAPQGQVVALRSASSSLSCSGVAITTRGSPRRSLLPGCMGRPSASRSDTHSRGDAHIKRETRKGSLQKETDTSSPRGAACPTYRHQGHASNAFAAMERLKDQRLLCDVVLVADDGMEVPAHRLVLAASSPYFLAMFAGDLSEAAATRVSLQEVDGWALEQLVRFVYTSEVKVSEDTVQNLLSAASLLQLTEVEEACCDYLQSQLHPSNCLGIMKFAELHNCRELLACATQYTEQHFVEVVTEDEFLNLSADQVCQFVSSDRLSVKKEETVFEAVCSWVNRSETRQQHSAQVLAHVRLPFLSRDYLCSAAVCSSPMFSFDPRCKDYLIEALRFQVANSLTVSDSTAVAIPASQRTRPRAPIGQPKALLILGGQAPKAIRSVEVSDFKGGRWRPVAEMPSRRCRCGVAVLDSLVYAIGGFNGSSRVKTVDAYDPVKDVWTSVRAMDARRSTLGVAALGGLLYAVGGFDGAGGLSTVERYDPLLNEWQPVVSMGTRRSSVGVGVVGGILYAVGGYDGSSRQCLSSVETFDSQQERWTRISDMTCRRSGAGVGVVDEALYAVGGHDGPLVRRSVEVYQAETDTWTQVADMRCCRRNAGVISHEGLLYVVGGDDGSTNLNSVEVYDPKRNTWTTVAMRMMSGGRSYAGVAVIDKVGVAMPAIEKAYNDDCQL